MKRPSPRQSPVTAALLLLFLLLVFPRAASAAESEPVRFGRDVLPLLADRCFHCHGPDAGNRKADLRLDQEEAAKAAREDGDRALVAGDLEASALWRRITATDDDERMPPPDAHRKPLTPPERETIRTWILEGAEWGVHWAFEKPHRPAVPDLATHPVDAFVRAGLLRHGLKPAPMAPPHTQARRASFDLTGLPPSPEDVAAFEAAPTAEAWRAHVDRLLASPHHGERLAMWWLDAARYSDTDGYQGDAERSNWPWRDWVVAAFTANMPFDQFTLEQFAGDLLPDASPEQILATCFHRNHMTNGEGGRHPEESRIDYVIDRVNTVGTVWLGLTLGCTQCHSHKFDPISQKDYYSLFAYFNSIDEDGKAGSAAKPYLKYQSPLAQGAVEQAEAYAEAWKPREARARAAAEERFAHWLVATRATLDPDYRAWRTLEPRSLVSAEGTEFDTVGEGIVQTAGPHPRQDDYRVTAKVPADLSRITGWKLEVFPHPSHTAGKFSRGATGEFILTNVKFLLRSPGESQVRDVDMNGAKASFEKGARGRNYGNVQDTLDDDPRNGWTTEGSAAISKQTAVFALTEPIPVRPDQELSIVLLHRSTIGDANIGRFRLAVTDQIGETVGSLQTAPLESLAGAGTQPSADIDPLLRRRLLDQFLLDDAEYQAVLLHYNAAKRQLDQTRKAAGERSVMVLAEKPEARDTHILLRGVWDAKGAPVDRAVLPAILPWPSESARTRIDLARWLVSPDNPLTARVTVNHLWQLVFGAGLVRTPEDFGLQGEVPSHPDLLDWLAVELVESGWDLRHVIRILVTSETYRQSSDTTSELRDHDPENRWLARASRFRLPAWMIRDNALKASGLLNPSVGGPPIKPWQPEGVWKEIFMGRFTYEPSVGPAQYRRTLYAYWRRSSAPTFLFDSAQRRVCEVGIRRTNTPLHALTLLNDRTLFEASRQLALDALRDPASSTGERLQEFGRRVLSRRFSADELAVLEREWQRALSHYSAHPEDAKTFVTRTLLPASDASDIPTFPALAAHTLMASLVLNLDEAMTHE